MTPHTTHNSTPHTPLRFAERRHRNARTVVRADGAVRRAGGRVQHGRTGPRALAAAGHAGRAVAAGRYHAWHLGARHVDGVGRRDHAHTVRQEARRRGAADGGAVHGQRRRRAVQAGSVLVARAGQADGREGGGAERGAKRAARPCAWAYSVLAVNKQALCIVCTTIRTTCVCVHELHRQNT